jgi:hypothetical protein
VAANGSHGGRRVGAGRKPKLGPLEKLHIGFLCDELQEKLNRRALVLRLRHELESKLDRPSELWHDLNNVEVSKRPELLRLADLPPEDMDGPLADLATELQSHRLTLDGEGVEKGQGRLIRVRKPRLRLRDAIIHHVARKETRGGRPITARSVRSCWSYSRNIKLGALAELPPIRPEATD